MSAADDARNAIGFAIDALNARLQATSDAGEKPTITNTITVLEAQQDELDEMELADAAHTVANLADALEGCVKAAQAGPFDSYLSQLENTINGLQTAQAEMWPPIRLWPTDVPGVPAAAAQPAPAPVQEPEPGLGDVAAPAALPAVGAGRDPASLADEYNAYFAACTPDETHNQTINWYFNNVTKSRATYQGVGSPIGVPWFFIGLIHGLECGFNFGTHLHNGDPLTARTVHVPRGRPVSGNPTFPWTASATDALTYQKFANQANWSLPYILFRLESYNGFGYRRQGLATPYLWSYSNLYKSGKYVSDGVFDPNAVSEQCGAAVMLKTLVNNGVVALP